MLKTTFSKIKRVCSIAFIPRILQRDVKYAAQKKFTKLSMVSSKASKSSSSNSGTTKSYGSHENDKINETDENVAKCAERNLAEERERCNRIISKVFPPGDPLYANPTDREIFEQKFEHLNEVPSTGNPILDDRKTNVLEQKETDSSNIYYEPESNNYDDSFDDVANRCLTTPPKHVDEQLLKELGTKYTPDNVDFYTKPTQSFYSQILHGKAKVNSVVDSPKPNENLKADLISDVQVDKAFKSETIQPLVLDTVSLHKCVDKGSEGFKVDALRDNQLGPVMNPYTYQSFPFHHYAFEKDMQGPNEKKAITGTTGGKDVGNDNLIPPNEMEIEIDNQSVREKVKGVVTGLSMPAGETPTELKPITSMGESADGILYTKPSSGPTGETPGTIKRQPEKTVKPQTSISSKNKDEKKSNPTSSSISDNQNSNDSDNIIKASNIRGRHDFLFNRESNIFPTKGPSEGESIYPRKTIVSYVDGSYKRPVIEIKIPVYNTRETDLAVEENTVHFKETDAIIEKDTVSYIQNKDNKSYKFQKTDEMAESRIKEPEKSPSMEKSDNINVHLIPKYHEMGKSNQKAETRSNLSTNLTATGPIPNIVEEDTVTLKEMLRRIRERHRQELCQDYYNQLTNMTMTESCKPKALGPDPCQGKNKPPCPPPPKCPSTTQTDPCAPKKDPCAPKTDPCKPKDPCAKFSLPFGSKILDTVRTLQAYFIPDYRSINFQYRLYSSEILSIRTLQINSLNSFIVEKAEKQDVILKKDYEPWTPIPSWPIPKKVKKRPAVFPKDGCKMLPPPPFDSAFKDKPCVSFPKKKFSLTELFEYPILNTIED